MKNTRKKKIISITALLLSFAMITACSELDDDLADGTESDTGDSNSTTTPEETEELTVPEAAISGEDLSAYFKDFSFSDTYKNIGEGNPLFTQRFGADPTVLSYDGRVYIYMTADTYRYSDTGGELLENDYSNIKNLNVISSADLVNWTDHGWVSVAGTFGAAKWANNSWAPAAAVKNIDGKDKFFLYFSNGAGGIGVLESDSPTGPFVDPIGKALISRSTPNCSDVVWLFDPGVLVDDDGKAYIYFGGGIPDDEDGNPRSANPGTGRMAMLGDDMISLATDPEVIDIPYLFEAIDMIKIEDTYYLNYCTGWTIDSAGKKLGLDGCSIAYMTSDSPMGPFELGGTIYKNPGNYFKFYGNNHQAIFEFEGEHYIAYHSMMASGRMNSGEPYNYRTTQLDKVTINDDGSIKPAPYTVAGVPGVKTINPFEKTPATTIGTMGGVIPQYHGDKAYRGIGDMVVGDIETGDWILVYGADFGTDGADKLTVSVMGPAEGKGIIEVRLDDLKGEVVGYLGFNASEGNFRELTATLNKKITGEHNIIFAFHGEGFKFEHWYFS